MRKTNKYNYCYVLQGNYGFGWDDLVHYKKDNCTCDLKAFREAKNDIKAYRENERQASFRIIERKELKETI